MLSDLNQKNGSTTTATTSATGKNLQRCKETKHLSLETRSLQQRETDHQIEEEFKKCLNSSSHHTSTDLRIPPDQAALAVPLVLPLETQLTGLSLTALSLKSSKKESVYEPTEIRSLRSTNPKFASNDMYKKNVENLMNEIETIIGSVSKRRLSGGKDVTIPLSNFHKRETQLKKPQNTKFKRNTTTSIKNQHNKISFEFNAYKKSKKADQCISRTEGDGVLRSCGGSCIPFCCCCQPDPSVKLPNFLTVPKKNRATFGDKAFVYENPEQCIQRTRKSKQIVSTTLGTPVGVIYATTTANDYGTNLEAIYFASYLKSMALVYLKAIDEWTSSDLEMLIRQGNELVMQANPTVEQHSDIYNATEARINRTFVLDGYRFQIELSASIENDNLNQNLYKELKRFFHQKKYCLIRLRDWYLLLLKRNNVYFVLDFKGRDIETLLNTSSSSMQKLVPVLLCLNKLINVIHLIVNMSNLEGSEAFKIREIFFAEVVTPTGRYFTTDFGIRKPEYILINNNYSYLLSSLHLTLNPAVPVRNRSALSVGIAAMIASKIDHPATWNTKMLDKIICYGVNVCRRCWRACIDISQPLNLDTFPPFMHIGQFLVGFELTPQAYYGNWKNKPVLLDNEFRSVLKQALTKYNHLLFQINNQMYAIWHKHGFYYILDPYLHIVWGQPEGAANSMKYASIRLLRNVDILVDVFHHILMQSNNSASFFIHTLKINGLIQCNDCSKDCEIQIEDDLSSLNEYICFTEDFSACLNELGQLSDYMEDVCSEGLSIITVEPSSSMVEEEEGGGEEIGQEEEDIEVDASDVRPPMRHKKYLGNKETKGGKNSKGKSENSSQEKNVERNTPGGGGKNNNADQGEKRTDEAHTIAKTLDMGAKQKEIIDKSKNEDADKFKAISKTIFKDIGTENTKRKTNDSLSRVGTHRLNPANDDVNKPDTRESKRANSAVGTIRKSIIKDYKNVDMDKSSLNDKKVISVHVTKSNESHHQRKVRKSEKIENGKQKFKAEKFKSEAIHKNQVEGGKKYKKNDNHELGKKNRDNSKPEAVHTSQLEDTEKSDKNDNDKLKKNDTVKSKLETVYKAQLEDSHKSQLKHIRKSDELTNQPDDNRKSQPEDIRQSKQKEVRKSKQDLHNSQEDIQNSKQNGRNSQLEYPRRSPSDDHGNQLENINKSQPKGVRHPSLNEDGKYKEVRRSKQDDRNYEQSTRKSQQNVRKSKLSDISTHTREESIESKGLRISKLLNRTLITMQKKDSIILSKTRLNLINDKRKKTAITDVKKSKLEVKVSKHHEPFLSRPCFSKKPKNLIIARSKSSTYESIFKILHAGLRCSDRILIMTKVGNIVVFRGHDYMEDLFFLYEGCTCHVDRFRYLDLSCGTFGLLPFASLHALICNILDIRERERRCTVKRYNPINRMCNICRKDNSCCG